MSNGKKLEVPQYHLEKVLFGGDQFTTARARSAKKARVNYLSSMSRLEGLIPCAEHFHVKLNFLDVSVSLITVHDKGIILLC